MLRVADIDRFWPLVEKGGREIERKTGEPVDLDMIRKRTRDGEFRLLIDPPKAGFLVVQFKVQPNHHIFIWLAWSAERSRLIDRYTEELSDMGRKVGAEYLRMRSRRKGFERCGWMISRMDATGITYRKDI